LVLATVRSKGVVLEISDTKVHLTAYDKGNVVTVDNSGSIRLWEINQSQIAKSLEVWKSNVGGIL
jgi:phosphoribosylaminoimidazole-succinocarboxamide synthase